jgi:hypothetical protein
VAEGGPLGSRYVLEERIGHGGMGEVWRGESPEGPVAIKVLRSDLADDPEVVSRFVQERTILRGLSSPNIVTVRDLVIEGDRLAIVMELVAGTNLRTLLATEGNLAPADSIGIMVQVLDGLAGAHARGVVHRDLKPENVLVTVEGPAPQVKIVDFGIARLVEGTRLSRTTGMIGTPQYLAPEIGSGHPATPASDVYAAGVVLYELLFGRAPFDRPTPVAVLHAHVNDPPTRPPDLPDALWDAIARTLAKDPAARPDATEAAALLIDAIGAPQDAPARFARLERSPADRETVIARGSGNGPPPMPPPIPGDDGGPARRSRRWGAVAAAGVAIVLVAGGIALATRDLGEPQGICEDGMRWQQHGTTIQDGVPVVRDSGTGTGPQLAGVLQGGALLAVPDPAEGAAMGFTSYRPINEREFDALDRRPRDGSLLKERGYPDGGRLFYSVAGATFEIGDPASLRKIGVNPDAAVVVPHNGLDTAPRAPRSGTLLHVQGTDQTWVIDGGARRPARNICSGARVGVLPNSPGVLDAIPIAP